MGYRENVVKIAKSQIGQAEPTQDDKYIKWYNSVAGTALPMNAPWCAMFASWVLRQAKVAEGLMPNFASCETAIKWAKRKKIWYSRLTSHLPQAGELVFFDWDGDTVQDHVGIVETATANQITVIEGNTSDRVDRKVYARTSRYILGYIDIQYPESTTTVTTTSTTATSVAKKITVKDVQKYMNDTYGMSIAVDGTWGPKSKKAMVMCIQSELNRSRGGHLKVDGIFGYATKKTWVDLKSGSKGRLVTLMQGCLIANGATLLADGVFGAKTLAAVKAFQQQERLTVDGIVGSVTISGLVK